MHWSISGDQENKNNVLIEEMIRAVLAFSELTKGPGPSVEILI